MTVRAFLLYTKIGAIVAFSSRLAASPAAVRSARSQVGYEFPLPPAGTAALGSDRRR